MVQFNSFILVIFSLASIASCELATKGQFPFHANVQTRLEEGQPEPPITRTCAGVIVGPRHVATMGNCFRIVPTPLQVAVGCTTYNGDDCQLYDVESYRIHPSWSLAMFFPYNFGVMTLAQDIQFNENVAPISVSSRYVRRNSTGTMLGWNLEGSAQWDTVNTTKICDCIGMVSTLEPTYGFDYEDQFICSESLSGGPLGGQNLGGALIVDDELAGVFINVWTGGLTLYARADFYVDFVNSVINGEN